MSTLFQAIPSVDACLAHLAALPEADAAPRALVRRLVQNFLEQKRQDIRENRISDPAALHPDALFPALAAFVEYGLRPSLRPVINATGVVIHTNLGRSPLPDAALEAIVRTSGYCNLEYQLETGERGDRNSIAEALIRELTGAEAAIIVNNNAAAVLLMLDSLAKGGEVLVSRGQLVEIGGSFRIPDVMARSGAILHEVGTTNCTHKADFENALNDNTRALLRVHTSNYRIVGFHTDVPIADMADIAHARDLPLLEDLGSGSLIDLTPWGLPGEPTARSILAAGADVVTCSGDKVLGGPQAGIIAGKARYIAPMLKNPLLRALRCDKTRLAALEATLRLYLDPEKAREAIPTLRMLTTDPQTLAKRAASLKNALRKALTPDQAELSLLAGVSRAGGGSFPERDISTTLLCLTPKRISPDELRARLLKADPPLIGLVNGPAFMMDPRTLTKAEFPAIARVLAEALA